MKSPRVTYVSRSELFPVFGNAEEVPPIIKIRKDLPKVVQKFVLSHEKYHIKDWQRLAGQNKRYYWILGEIKANVYGAIKHPFGFLLCVIMSLQPYRIKFYLRKFKKGK
jgi:hypothetical protein